MCVCVWMCACARACVCVCIYIYIYIYVVRSREQPPCLFIIWFRLVSCILDLLDVLVTLVN